MTDGPIPVTIEAPTPLPVEVVSGPVRPSATPVQSQSGDPSLPARTTFQEDLMTAGQRHINLKWEGTQQVIAIAVTVAVLLVCSYIIVLGDEALKQAAFIFLTNIAFLVVGTYFQRTNHTKTGGVGTGDVGR